MKSILQAREIQKWILRACKHDAATQNNLILWKDKAGTIVMEVYFFMAARCGAHRTPARDIESILRDIHQQDSFYRAARAIDAKIGVLVVDDIAFHA